MKITSKTKQNWVNSLVWCSGLDRMEQVNSLMTLPIIGELFNLFTFCYAINAGRQICWLAKFPVPYETHRRRVAKRGEGNITYGRCLKYQVSRVSSDGAPCKPMTQHGKAHRKTNSLAWLRVDYGRPKYTLQ